MGSRPSTRPRIAARSGDHATRPMSAFDGAIVEIACTRGARVSGATRDGGRLFPRGASTRRWQQAAGLRRRAQSDARLTRAPLRGAAQKCRGTARSTIRCRPHQAGEGRRRGDRGRGGGARRGDRHSRAWTLLAPTGGRGAARARRGDERSGEVRPRAGRDAPAATSTRTRGRGLHTRGARASFYASHGPPLAASRGPARAFVRQPDLDSLRRHPSDQ